MMHVSESTYYTDADTKHFSRKLCSDEEINLVRTTYAGDNYKHMDKVKAVCAITISTVLVIGILSLSLPIVLLAFVLTVVYSVSTYFFRKHINSVFSKQNVVRYEAIVLKKYDPIPVDSTIAVYPILVKDAYSSYQTVLYVPQQVYEEVTLYAKVWRHRLLDTDKSVI